MAFSNKIKNIKAFLTKFFFLSEKGLFITTLVQINLVVLYNATQNYIGQGNRRLPGLCLHKPAKVTLVW